jgi:AmmeMemoRadiSam system protein B
MTGSMERPRLRPGLAAAPDRRDARFMILWDRLGLSPHEERLSLREFTWVQMFDGERTLREIQIEAVRQENGRILPIELFADLVRKLDEALFLDGGRFRERLGGPVREPACVGCYEADPAGLRRQVAALFNGPKGPGLPRPTRPDGSLKAALVPHIDYHRGGHSFAWGFKEVVEHADAALFVIIGTAHYSSHRFTLTRQHFKTPLGIVPTDQDYIDRLVKHHGDGLFDDSFAHLPEHSIELEVVFLQYLYEGKRPFRIVPLVVGPFSDCVDGGYPPGAAADIGRMIEALRCAEAETPEPICYLISGDLAHIGPKFGDPKPVAASVLSYSRQKDHELLRAAEAVDMAGYFDVIHREDDRRRICGLPPTYTLLEALRPRRGKLLHYDQYVHPRGFESVSFASMGFYR